MAISYKDAGVDVERGYKAVELMKKHVKSTFDGNVLSDIGSFGGFYSIENFKFEKPVLVAGTDGVGTKLKYAFSLKKFDTVGIDLVAMCVNDIICQGARPLLFLDYIASGKIEPERIADIVKGIAVGCRESGAALIGGETAEMPGFYSDGEFDLAGFSVGIVDKDKIISGADIKCGNVLIGVASSGVHSNGFSLVRKLYNPEDKMLMNAYSNELQKTVGEALLTPTRIYVKSMLNLISRVKINGIAHITGGGFIENIPRFLPNAELGVKINLNSYPLPPIFRMLWDKAGISKEQIYNTFNMGIGLVLAVDKDNVDSTLSILKEQGETAYIIGEVTGKAGVELL